MRSYSIIRCKGPTMRGRARSRFVCCSAARKPQNQEARRLPGPPGARSGFRGADLRPGIAAPARPLTAPAWTGRARACLRRACEQYGIVLEYRPVAQPHMGGHVERLLGTLMRALHELPGATFSSREY